MVLSKAWVRITERLYIIEYIAVVVDTTWNDQIFVDGERSGSSIAPIKKSAS